MCVGLTLGWQWPSVIFVVCGVMCFAVGPGPIPWMITSEILPPSVRAGGVTICVFFNWLFTFIVGQVCPLIHTRTACGCLILMSALAGCGDATLQLYANTFPNYHRCTRS